jgi:CheY-like chemotaxis protein
LSKPLDAVSVFEMVDRHRHQKASDRGTSATAVQRVLIVEDNEDAADALADLLELFGYQTRIAHDGPSALALVADYRPDAVLLDLGLPEMDGFAVCEAIRAQQHGGTARARMIALSGRQVDENTEKRLRDVGFDHHLMKPTSADTLRRVLSS